MLIQQMVFVWPNYDWCYEDEVEEYLASRSDDYMAVVVVISDLLNSDTAIDEYLKYYKPQG